MGTRIISIIITTFIVAMIYGLFLTTQDFMKPDYNPVASGHHAASNVYGLFGTVTNEIRENDGSVRHDMTVAHKIAMPYAVTADLSAILGGKIEVTVSSLIHRTTTPAPATHI